VPFTGASLLMNSSKFMIQTSEILNDSTNIFIEKNKILDKNISQWFRLSKP